MIDVSAQLSAFLAQPDSRLRYGDKPLTKAQHEYLKRMRRKGVLKPGDVEHARRLLEAWVPQRGRRPHYIDGDRRLNQAERQKVRRAIKSGKLKVERTNAVQDD